MSRGFLLTFIARYGTLPPGTTLAQAQALTGAIENCGGWWDLTDVGWAEVEALGRVALGA